MNVVVVCCLVFVALHVTYAKDPPGVYASECLIGQPQLYDSAQSYNVPWFTVNLDADPYTRWNHVVVPHKQQIIDALNTVKKMASLIGEGLIYDVLIEIMHSAIDKVPEPYKTELQGISAASGIDIGELTLMNLFYEVSKGCTSLVAEDANGRIYHARNQDFGTLFIWNSTLRTWQQTEALRALLVNINFVRNGRLLYKGITFAGHLGVLTGLMPSQFSLSSNSRGDNTLSRMISFLANGVMGRQFLMYVDRDVFEKTSNYDDALNYLSTTPMFAAAYFILGGARSGQGAIITRSANGTDHVQRLGETTPQQVHDNWYVLQTNYDWNAEPLYLDDRRYPGHRCMQRMTQANISHANIYQVLSSKPNLNKATVYTAVMQVNDGHIESFIRRCEDPCWFV